MSDIATRRPLRGLLLVYLVVSVLFGVAWLMVKAGDESLEDLTRDIFSIARLPVYTAFMTHAAVFLWGSAGVIAVFTAAVLRVGSKDRAGAGFLLAGGLFSLVLMLDDFFLMHEWLVPRFLGLPEEVAFLVYGALGVVFLVVFRRAILAAEPGLLLLAGVLFAVSIGLDQLESREMIPQYWLPEDAVKLLGISTWWLFFSRASVRELLAAMVRAAHPPA